MTNFSHLVQRRPKKRRKKNQREELPSLRKLPSQSLSLARRRSRKSKRKLSLVKWQLALLMMKIKKLLVMFPIAKLPLPQKKLLKQQLSKKLRRLPPLQALNKFQRKLHLLRMFKQLNRHLPRMYQFPNQLRKQPRKLKRLPLKLLLLLLKNKTLRNFLLPLANNSKVLMRYPNLARPKEKSIQLP